MDLDTLASTDTAVMEVVHPSSGAVLLQDDKKTAITITLASQDSDRVRAVDRRISNKRLTASAGGRRMTLTAEGIESDNLQKIIAATVSWSGIGFGGGSKECTPENAREVYTRYPWMREQAERFVEERGNFLKTSSAS